MRRASFIIILDLVNIGFILLGAIKQPEVSTYLLLVFIGNLMVYFFYYVTMKLVKKEKIPKIAIFISVLTIGNFHKSHKVEIAYILMGNLVLIE
jgi:hypothetical protein